MLSLRNPVYLSRLADRGHSVVGVEFIEVAVKNFFVKNNVEYTVENNPKYKGPLYKVR